MKVSVAAFLAFSWLWVAQAQAQTRVWTALGPADQHVLAIAVDPTAPATIYLGTMTDLLKTTDGGVSWQPRSAGLGLPVGEIEVDPKAPSTVYAVASLYATAPGLAFKTVDGGGTWSQLPIGPLVRSLKVDVTVSSTLYAATSQGVFRSRDAGASWASVSDGLTSLDVLQVLQAPSSPSTLYAAVQGAETLFRSRDSGETWSTVGESLPAGYISWGLEGVDPKSASTVYVSGVGSFGRNSGFESLFKSTDGGATLSMSPLCVVPPTLPNPECTVGINAFAIDPIAPSNLYMTQAAHVRRSLDGGANWIGFETPSETAFVTTLTLDPSSPSTVYVGTYFSGVFRSTFAGGCSASSAVLCLSSSRFLVEVSFDRGALTNPCPLCPGCFGCPGQTWPITSNTGAFWFFDPTNLELVVKVLDGRAINGKWWVFYGSLTNVEFTLTVTDTQTGTIRTYVNPQGQLASVADTSAF